MDAAIIFTAIIVSSIIVGAFILMSRRGDGTGEESAELIRLAEEKANAESALNSTRTDLDAANLQLETARQFEIHNAKLATDLENERSLHKRVTEELNASQNRREELQSQNQKLTAAISGIKAELEAKNTSLQEESSENSELRRQSAELTEHVNALTAKVSNLNTQLQNAEERLVERGELEKLFGDRFKSMSSETLANQQKQFLERATETLKPLSQKVDKLDREWATTSGAFKQQIETLANETQTLSNALARPQSRGELGELNVERVLEVSGLTKGIHYETQVSNADGGRPDFVVHLPDNRDIVLDSKVSLVAYKEAHEATSEEERARHLERHARQMQTHADDLARKDYSRNLPNAAEFVVMVVPDFALPPAVERRPDLIDHAHQNSVVISTHSTLVALLKAVALGWRERQLADEAQEIGLLGRELHDRLEVFAGHYADIGTALNRAVNRYNDGVGSLESRVLTQARRFPQLGVQSTKELPETQSIETTIRSMRSVTPADDSKQNAP